MFSFPFFNTLYMYKVIDRLAALQHRDNQTQGAGDQNSDSKWRQTFLMDEP